MVILVPEAPSLSQPVFGKRGRFVPAVAAAEEVRSPAYLELVAAARAGAALADDDAPISGRANREGGDMSLFIGSNWRTYRRLWADLEGAPRLRKSRCWAGGAFTSSWLLYRKQYLLGGALLAAQLGALYLDSWLSTGFDFLSVFFVGRYGKSIVLMSGYHAVVGIRALGLTPEASEQRIRETGGVNGFAFVAALGLIGFTMVMHAETLGLSAGSLNELGALQDLLTHSAP